MSIHSQKQEKYLRTFLNDPNVRRDNKTAERVIHLSTVGRKSWVMIDKIMEVIKNNLSDDEIRRFMTNLVGNQTGCHI